VAKSRKKPRKRAPHAMQLLAAAWNFALSYYDDASNWETHEEKMAAAIRRILREARRG
jgi:cysteine synthase